MRVCPLVAITLLLTASVSVALCEAQQQQQQPSPSLVRSLAEDDAVSVKGKKPAAEDKEDKDVPEWNGNDKWGIHEDLNHDIQDYNHMLEHAYKFQNVMYYYKRNDVGLKGFAYLAGSKFSGLVKKVDKIIKYLQSRGHYYEPQDIKKLYYNDDSYKPIENLKHIRHSYVELYEATKKLYYAAKEHKDAMCTVYIEKSLHYYMYVANYLSGYLTTISHYGDDHMGMMKVNKMLYKKYGNGGNGCNGKGGKGGKGYGPNGCTPVYKVAFDDVKDVVDDLSEDIDDLKDDIDDLQD